MNPYVILPFRSSVLSFVFAGFVATIEVCSEVGLPFLRRVLFTHRAET